ncbi:MAG TPA: hypothetical protein DIV86_02515 [Alphaproteobacteria bacterium]|nr:hypothetical protein [Alphaproteobacteria bacterium]
MDTIYLSENYSNSLPCALAAGNFDGVHKGHKEVIKTLLETAEKYGLTPAIINFEPNPYEYFKQIKNNYRITHLSEKQKLFSKEGIKKLFIAKFDKNFSNISANEFLKKIISEKLNAKKLITGEDFVFGKNREGNSEYIKNNKFDFDYQQVELLHSQQKKKYSSTEIRELINKGEIKKANDMLGHEFFIIEKVISGNKNGRKLGFPTANLNIQKYIKPPYGVYRTETEVDGKTYNSISNFGVKPTINNNSEELLETHILNFSENIYGKIIAVKFYDFIRKEIKFNSLDELKKQITLDIKPLTYE